MTERKPPSEPIDSWIERQTREAAARGELDDLEGMGKPIEGLDRPHDPNWWVKDKLRREEASLLPPALALRRDVEKALREVLTLADEAAVREAVALVNERIVETNAAIIEGPPSTVMPLDVDEVVRRWRAARVSPSDPTRPT